MQECAPLLDRVLQFNDPGRVEKEIGQLGDLDQAFVTGGDSDTRGEHSITRDKAQGPEWTYWIEA